MWYCYAVAFTAGIPAGQRKGESACGGILFDFLSERGPANGQNER
jgi:hypothetical protein